MQRNGNYSNANIIICIDKIAPHTFSGRIYHRYIEEEKQFSDVGHLLIKIEELLNQAYHPSASTISRYFAPPAKPESNGNNTIENEGDLIVKHSDEKGERATFLIQIQYRQNSTWQGTVKWVEENKEQRFRSALELIKLMDNVNEISGS